MLSLTMKQREGGRERRWQTVEEISGRQNS